MQARLLFGLAIVFAVGCGPKKFASVSGKVTLNGKPLANAIVAFQPSVDASPGSTGKTNENGEYTLKTNRGENGAAVCKHRVLISALEGKGEGDERRSRRGGRRGGRRPDKIPSRYGPRGKAELSFVVPPEGTDKADFALKSP